MSHLANPLIKNSSEKTEYSNGQENSLLKNGYWHIPVTFFYSALNAIWVTGHYAYRGFRKGIQTMIDKKPGMIALESWNKETVNKEKFHPNIEVFVWQ